LRHCFVESPTRGDNIYRYVIKTNEGKAVIKLPEYFKFLNEKPQILITAEDVMGYGYGKVSEDLTEVNINVTLDGTYSVVVIGTRKDQLVKEYWDKDGAEIPPQ
jgi:hypothetical protein